MPSRISLGAEDLPLLGRLRRHLPSAHSGRVLLSRGLLLGAACFHSRLETPGLPIRRLEGTQLASGASGGLRAIGGHSWGSPHSSSHRTWRLRGQKKEEGQRPKSPPRVSWPRSPGPTLRPPTWVWGLTAAAAPGLAQQAPITEPPRIVIWAPPTGRYWDGPRDWGRTVARGSGMVCLRPLTHSLP